MFQLDKTDLEILQNEIDLFKDCLSSWYEDGYCIKIGDKEITLEDLEKTVITKK